MTTQFPNSAFDHRDKLHFTKPCRRIAVCVYGQYRTGDVALPHLAKLFSSTNNIYVDFFASCKTSSSKITDDSSAERINHILNQSVINFTSINVIDSEYDDRVADNSRAKLFHGISDVIRLKMQYEAEHDFVYDIVVLTRFDTLIHPMDIMIRMVNWYNNVSDSVFRHITHGAKGNNWMCTEYTHNNYKGGGDLTGVQDYFMWGGSVSFDVLAVGLLEQISIINAKSSEGNIPYEFLDGHNACHDALIKGGIGICGHQPYLSGNDNLCFRDEFFMGGGKHINAPWLLVRACILRDDPALYKLNLSKYESFDIIANHWVNGINKDQ